MTTMQTLTAKPRTPAGKSETRRLRKAGSVPAIAYGKGRPATALSVTPKEVVTILRSERGKNTLVQVTVEGQSEFLAMIKDFSYHPLTRNLEHVDLIEVKLEQQVLVEIPLVTVGKPLGVTAGGLLRQVYRMVPVSCLPNQIPLKIEHDVTSLNLNEATAAKDLKLPEGVSVMLPAEQTVISVVAPEKDRTEDVAALPGAAAAPAAGAKDAKAPAAAPAKDAKKK
jgi:large subunit ribosomal protein L25